MHDFHNFIGIFFEKIASIPLIVVLNICCLNEVSHQSSLNFVEKRNLKVVNMSNNTIYIGNKPIANYCQAIIQTLNGNDTAKLLARGTAISRAVDAVEVTRNRYLDGVTVQSIKIGTEELRGSDGGMRNVSNMTIILEKSN